MKYEFDPALEIITSYSDISSCSIASGINGRYDWNFLDANGKRWINVVVTFLLFKKWRSFGFKKSQTANTSASG